MLLNKLISSSYWLFIYSLTDSIRFSILVDVVATNCFIFSRILSCLLAVRESKGVELVFESLFGPILVYYNKILVNEESYVKGIYVAECFYGSAVQVKQI